MFDKKRAQGIPMETVIIAIIVLVVLVVVIAFFISGTGKAGSGVWDVFTKQQGDTLASAKETCNTLCDQATQANLDLSKSAFCTRKFKIDEDGNGEADKNAEGKYKAFYCSPDIGVSCGQGCTDLSRRSATF